MTDELDFEISDDSDLKTLVRGMTNYADNEEELPDSILDSQIRIAKLRLKNKTDATNFYTDDGLAQALLGTTCILAKCAAENYSIDSWEIGSSYIDVRTAGSDEQIHFDEWTSMVTEGLQASDGSTAGPLPNVTRSYIG